jgi:hypothetical protein
MAQKMTLDFSQVKDGNSFSPKHKEEGEYLGTIISFEDTKSKAGNAMWVFGVQLKSDRRAVYPVYCVLTPESLWKLRDLLVSAGFKVPKKRLTFDGSRAVGKDIGIFLEDDEYEGKKKSVITSFFPADEYDGPQDGVGDDDEELPEEDEDESDDEEYGDNYANGGSTDSDEDDEDDEDGEEEEPAPAPKKVAKSGTKVKKAPEPADDEDDEDDDEMDVEDL